MPRRHAQVLAGVCCTPSSDRSTQVRVLGDRKTRRSRRTSSRARGRLRAPRDHLVAPLDPSQLSCREPLSSLKRFCTQIATLPPTVFPQD